MKLNIKAKDFKETSYTNGSDCVITRALHRAGLTGHKDAGLNIENQFGNDVVSLDNNRNYRILVKKVIAMYAFLGDCEPFFDDKPIKPLKPKNFSINLKL